MTPPICKVREQAANQTFGVTYPGGLVSKAAGTKGPSHQVDMVETRQSAGVNKSVCGHLEVIHQPNFGGFMPQRFGVNGR